MIKKAENHVVHVTCLLGVCIYIVCCRSLLFRPEQKIVTAQVPGNEVTIPLLSPA